MKILKQTAIPTVEPITLTELKAYLAICDNDSDNYLTELITACRQQIEIYLSRSLITQTWDYKLDLCDLDFKPIYLLRPEIQTINSVKIYDQDDNESTWAATNYSLIDERLVFKKDYTIDITFRQYACFIINYDAGYGDNASDVPLGIKQALLDYCQYVYECGCEEIPGKLKIQLNSYKSLNGEI